MLHFYLREAFFFSQFFQFVHLHHHKYYGIIDLLILGCFRPIAVGVIIVKTIKCENYFCVYFCDGMCRLEQLDLSITGACCSCIYVDIDEAYLNRQREKLLSSLRFYE